tara:strand:- start:353 stop:1225 length:873 start_codon:yes stop_codon:yes gene_type:complete
MLFPKDSIDYQLIDCGNFRKLERFGKIIVDRPEIEASWKPNLPKKEWEKADWHFFEQKGKTGIWSNKTNAPNSWKISYKTDKGSYNFQLKITAFKHVGIFPEQAVNWEFIEENLNLISGEKKVLNLFAYTGAASVVAAKSNATVTNVDSVKQVINWGKENAELNKVDTIRWIQEDALKFVDRALRRGEKFQGIIMDPPAYGHGPKKEIWKLEKNLPELLNKVIQLVDPKNHFLILNTYSSKLNSEEFQNILKNTESFPKEYTNEVLGLSSANQQNLPLGNLVRFSKLKYS